MATENNRVDTTFIGYFLIGFILLLFGVFGLQHGGLFGEYSVSNIHNYPLDIMVVAQICGAIGLILVLLTIFAYRTGKKTSACIFAFTALSLIFFYFDQYADSLGDLTGRNSNWFAYIAIAIFFLILAIYVLVEKAPKFVALLLLLLAFTMFFMGLACAYSSIGPICDIDVMKAMGIVFGIFAFLGFIVAVYLGLAYADTKKIPLI